jgi:hypothetical protein
MVNEEEGSCAMGELGGQIPGFRPDKKEAAMCGNGKP